MSDLTNPDDLIKLLISANPSAEVLVKVEGENVIFDFTGNDLILSYFAVFILNRLIDLNPELEIQLNGPTVILTSQLIDGIKQVYLKPEGTLVN